MAQSYPIWIDVSGDNYKQSKSFGSRDHVTMDIKVGSSRSYSNDLARVSFICGRTALATEPSPWLWMD